MRTAAAGGYLLNSTILFSGQAGLFNLKNINMEG